MPLLDHFHPPLYPVRHWESFHAQWASAIAESLNRSLLPKDYFAEVQSHVGSRVEIDIGTFHSDEYRGAGEHHYAAGGEIATLPAPAWAPSAPAMSIPAVFPDSIEALIYNNESGATLVAAVELVSPGNKDREEFRRAFAAKCATYLEQGVGLVIIDIVTSRRGNLHNELIQLLGVGEQFEIATGDLYATAYRPIRRPDVERIDIWTFPLTIGTNLPLLPLALDKGLCLPLDLEPPYMDACRRSRLPG